MDFPGQGSDPSVPSGRDFTRLLARNVRSRLAEAVYLVLGTAYAADDSLIPSREMQGIFAELSANLADAAWIMGHKARTYGTTNIAVQGGMGVSLRIQEKLARIANMMATANAGKDVSQEEESPRVTALDVANLGLLLSLVVDGSYPGATWAPRVVAAGAPCSHCGK